MDSEQTILSAGSKRPASTAEAGEDGNSDSAPQNTPITADGCMPQKRFYRSRAHCNPLSHNDTFDYPLRPSEMDWSVHFENKQPPSVLDVGCGFGGLTVRLAELFPYHNILGLEIRAKVAEYVRLRIVALRQEHPSQYQNASVLRTNSMKYLIHYCSPASLDKMFFCFPDPHFKRKNHPRRIVSTRLLSEYAYLLKEGGRLYCITDVHELHEWHVKHLEAHPLFRHATDTVTDVCVQAMQTATEESQKVERAGGGKYFAVYERIPNSQVTLVVEADSFFSKDQGESKDQHEGNDDNHDEDEADQTQSNNEASEQQYLDP